MTILSKRQLEIIDVSMKLIATKGIQNLTIKNVAGEIGISEPAIYRHFENKKDILLNIVASFEEESLATLSAFKEKHRDPLEKLEAFIMSRYEVCAADHNLAKVMFSEENFQNDPELSQRMLQMMHSHRDIVATIVLDAQKIGHIRSDIEVDCLFRIIFGPVRLLVKQWCLNGFAFSLLDEGKRLWDAERRLITTTTEYR
jgi:TetR/AcrR family fatty acid metabolism transcriptional regulator